jgi:hypothetical protein
MLQIHGVSRMLGQTSARQNMEKGSYQYMSAKGFRGTAPTFARPESFPGSPKTLVCSAVIQNKQALHQRIFYACQTIRNCPRNLRKCATVHDQKCRCVH